MNKKISITVSVLVLCLIPVAGYGLKKAKNAPVNAENAYISETVDRVDISVDATSFEYKNHDGGESEFSFIFSVKKTEPDFYAKIEKFDIAGTEYSSAVFEALGSTPDGSVTEGLTLSAENGMPSEYSWKVTVFTEGKPSSGAYLELIMTTGISALTSEKIQKNIPLDFSFD